MPIFKGLFSYAPFPEGFQGDMDETFQQSGQLATIYISGNFLSGLYYPIGTVPTPTLPTSDQGPIVVNGQWYFWDPVSNQYLPQTTSIKTARNYAKNAIYQIQQVGTAPFTLATGTTKTFDLTNSIATGANYLSVDTDTGPLAGPDNDYCIGAIKYVVGPNVLATPASADQFFHEHLIEGRDIQAIQGETLSLSFSVWCNQTGTYSAYITNGNRDMSYVFNFAIAVASQWTRIKITNIPAMPTGTGTWSFGEGTTGLRVGVAMAVGSQWQTSTPKQWVSGFFAGTAQNTNMLTVVNNQMKITGIKLEASAATTYFTANSFEQDFNDAIRYYFTTFTYQSLIAGVPIMGISQGTNLCVIPFVFPRRMAKVPTVVPYGYNSHTIGNITNISTVGDAAVATLAATAKGIIGVPTPTCVKGDVFLTYITADARLS